MLVMTVLQRQEKPIYVSVWYILGAVLWTVSFYPLGNVMWHPRTGALEGTVDAIWLWFYGHNIFGLYLTPLAIAIMYYVMPRLAKRPLYSHTLSLVGFWTLLAFYTHIGAHHLLQAPVPLWLKSISVIDSVGMILPVATVLVNLWMTTKDNVGAFVRSVPGKWIYLGRYLVPHRLLPGPAAVACPPCSATSISTIGWSDTRTERSSASPEWSPSAGSGTSFRSWRGGGCGAMNLANLQFWLILTGITGFFVVLTIAGLDPGRRRGSMERRIIGCCR